MSLALVLFLALTAAPTDTELTALGQAIAADFAEGRDPISPRFGNDEFFQRMLPGVAVPAGPRAKFLTGFKTGLAQSWAALAAESKEGTRLTYQRNVTLDGLPAVQLRLLFKDDGGFNFLEFPVMKNARGELLLVDIFELTLGGLRSAEARLIFVPLLEKHHGGVLKRLFAADAPILKHLPAINQMSAALRERRLGDAVALWKALPVEVREHRLPFTAYLNTISQLEEPATYEQALTRFMTLYPADPAAQMWALEHALVTQQWEKAVAALAVVEKRVGRDAWFDVLRADFKPQDARKSLEAAVTLEPSLEGAWLRLISLGLAEQRYAEVAKWMQNAEKSAGLGFDLRADQFKGFSASKEGKTWAKAHPPP